MREARELVHRTDLFHVFSGQFYPNHWELTEYWAMSLADQVLLALGKRTPKERERKTREQVVSKTSIC